MNQNVRSSKKFGEPIAGVGVVQVKPSAPLANSHFGDHPWFKSARRIDAQNVRSEDRQESRRDRTGKNAREVENAYAVQRASCVLGYPPAGENGGLAPIDQRFSR
jgi:hypothetical protein